MNVGCQPRFSDSELLLSHLQCACRRHRSLRLVSGVDKPTAWDPVIFLPFASLKISEAASIGRDHICSRKIDDRFSASTNFVASSRANNAGWEFVSSSILPFVQRRQNLWYQPVRFLRLRATFRSEISDSSCRIISAKSGLGCRSYFARRSLSASSSDRRSARALARKSSISAERAIRLRLQNARWYARDWNARRVTAAAVSR